MGRKSRAAALRPYTFAPFSPKIFARIAVLRAQLLRDLEHAEGLDLVLRRAVAE